MPARCIALVLLVCVAAALSACERDTVPPPRATPTAATVVSTSVSREQDPRALASYLSKRSAARDWAAIDPYLTDEFRSIGVGDDPNTLDFWLAPAAPEAWDVEDRGDMVIVRQREMTPVAIVFRRQANGELRIDLGPHAIRQMLYQRAVREQSRSLARVSTAPVTGPNQMTYDLSPARRSTDYIMIHSHFDRTLSALTTRRTGRVVTITFSVIRRASARIALDGITWSPGEASGTPNIIWSTAVLTDDALLLPYPDTINGNLLPYTVAFELPGAPANQPIRMRFPDITLAQSDGGRLTFALDCTFQAGEYPVIE